VAIYGSVPSLPYPPKLLKQLTTAEVVRLLLRCWLPLFHFSAPRIPRHFSPLSTFSLPATAASRQLLKSRQRHSHRQDSRNLIPWLGSVVDVHLALVVIATLSSPKNHLRQKGGNERSRAKSLNSLSTWMTKKTKKIRFWPALANSLRNLLRNSINSGCGHCSPPQNYANKLGIYYVMPAMSTAGCNFAQFLGKWVAFGGWTG